MGGKEMLSLVGNLGNKDAKTTHKKFIVFPKLPLKTNIEFQCKAP